MAKVALSWGTEMYGSSGNGGRVGIEVVESLSADEAKATYTVRFWFWSRWSCADTSNSSSLDGFVTASRSNDNLNTSVDSSWSTSNQKMVASYTLTVDRQYGQDSSTYQKYKLNGVDIAGGQQLYHKVTWSVPKRPCAPPAAVPSVTATQVSDTTQKVDWTGATSTTSAPVTTYFVTRVDDNSGNAKQVSGQLSNTVRSYQDSTTAANHRYDYQVASANSDYTTYSTSTAVIYTTPAAPSNAIASKNADGSITVSWTNNARWANRIIVWDMAGNNGGNMADVSGNLSSTTTSFRVASPDPATTHKYYVQAVTPNSLTATSTPTDVVQLLAPPNAPTTAAKSVMDAAEVNRFTWNHNPVDSSVQTAARFRYAPTGTTNWTQVGNVATTAQYWDMPANTWTNGNTYDWQVSTKGAYAGTSPDPWSPWSATKTTKGSARPSGSYVGDSTFYGSQIILKLSFYDPEGRPMSGGRGILYDITAGDAKVGEFSWSGTALTVEVPLTVQDNHQYRAEVFLTDADSMESEVINTGTLTVQFQGPTKPSLLLSYDRINNSVTITTINPPSTGNEPAALYNDLWATIDGRVWRFVGRVDPDGTMMDYLPELGVRVWYYAVANSSLPSDTGSDPVSVFTSNPLNFIVINGGENFGTMRYFRGNPKVKTSRSRAKRLREYVGRSKPVQYVGRMTRYTIDVSGVLEYGVSSTFQQLEDLTLGGQVVCYRDPAGRRVFCSMDGIDITQDNGRSVDISTGFTEVDYREVVREGVGPRIEGEFIEDPATPGLYGII